MRDDGVVDLEQKLQPVALALELQLRQLRALVVQDVVHGDRDLAGHVRHERQVGFVVLVRLEAAERHRAQPPQRRRDRHRAIGAHAVLEQHGDEPREARFVLQVADHQRLLRVHHEAGGRLIDGRLEAGLDRRRLLGGEHLQPHHVLDGIVEDEIDEVERHDARQPLTQDLEELVQIAIRGDRLGDLEQQAQPIALLAEVELRRAVALIVQHVVDGHRDLPRDETEKVELLVAERERAPAAESDGAQRAHDRRERQHAERLDADRADQLLAVRKLRRFLGAPHDERRAAS